jgi:hypothetical protein
MRFMLISFCRARRRVEDLLGGGLLGPPKSTLRPAVETEERVFDGEKMRASRRTADKK